MNKRSSFFSTVRDKKLCLFVLIGLIITFGACAAMKNQEAMGVERTLAAAGFQMKFADTPEKMDHLRTMEQRTVFPTQKDGKLYYMYADATSCKCLYVGTEKAYQRYQKLAIEQQIAQNQRNAAEMYQMSAMNWGMWGPWGPWYCQRSAVSLKKLHAFNCQHLFFSSMEEEDG